VVLFSPGRSNCQRSVKRLFGMYELHPTSHCSVTVFGREQKLHRVSNSGMHLDSANRIWGTKTPNSIESSHPMPDREQEHNHAIPKT
jgi:hypothetical protein